MNKYNKDVHDTALELLSNAVENSEPVEIYYENGNELRIRDFWATVDGIALEMEIIEE